MKTLITNKIPISLFRYTSFLFSIFLIGFMLLRYPEVASQGITDGVDICLGTLIPSLFPFLVLSTFIIESQMLSKAPKFLDKIAGFVFSLPGKCLSVILISLIGGMPLGCKMTCELYEKGEINLINGRRMMLFCFCCGPAFTISSVGFYMLGSKQAGVLIFLSLILSALTIGILSRFFDDGDNYPTFQANKSKVNPFSLSLVRSVSTGSTAILSICTWVILFACINRLIEILPFSESFSFAVCTLLEVTNGVCISAGVFPLPIITAIIGFGGFCGHCQVMPYILKLKLKYKYFLTSRILGAALSAIYCEVLMNFYPVTYEVFAMGTLPQNSQLTVSAVYSISMLATAGLFLLGDGAVFRIKTK